MQPTDILRAVLGAALIALCAACATVPPVQLAFAVGRDGIAVGSSPPCNGGATTANAGAALPLPGPDFRVLSWNLHKNDDPGWDADLARFAAASDLLLIQEAALTARLQRVLQDAGYDWLLASSFMLHDHATGVLSAARVRPASACVQRFFEPLLRLPKSAVITRYEVTGVAQRLAVANVHSINFTLGLGAYRAQLEAITRELADHRGPVIVAGDLNTWNATRLEVVRDVMQRMGLVSVLPWIDTRRRRSAAAVRAHAVSAAADPARPGDVEDHPIGHRRDGRVLRGHRTRSRPHRASGGVVERSTGALTARVARHVARHGVPGRCPHPCSGVHRVREKARRCARQRSVVR